MRRVGKSTLLKQIISLLLKEKTAPDHILYFSFDKHAIDKEYSALETLKFKTKIRNNDLKHLLDYSSSFGNQEAIVATKSTLDLQTISGVNVYFIPFYLI